MKELPHAYHSVAFAFALAASSACGMNVPAAPQGRCQVLNGDKLPAESGGSAELCAAIEQSAILRHLDGSFTVRVRVGPRSLLTADVTLADGRVLPSLNMAQMDRPIGKTTFKRFGDAVADHVAGASR